MSAQHTPGPWRHADGDAVLAGRDHSFAVVASVSRDEDRALIIASPDLLELLREAAEFIQPFNRAQGLLDKIDAAIAKAAGAA